MHTKHILQSNNILQVSMIIKSIKVKLKLLRNHFLKEEIDSFLKKAFTKYHYNIIEVPKLDVLKRVDFIINSL